MYFNNITDKAYGYIFGEYHSTFVSDELQEEIEQITATLEYEKYLSEIAAIEYEEYLRMNS